MKPNFALNLGHDGIGLFHRSKTGWQTIGTIALEDPELSAGLAMLRKTAVSLESGGMTVKILIPDSQILYTEIDMPDIAGQDMAAEIGQRLDGLTPYAPDELAFDWRPLGPGRVRLAVVARDTLAEAEAFACEHRFNPVAFAAAPSPEKFAGEPFFGPVASAAALLAEAGPISPDREALDVATLMARSGSAALASPVAGEDGDSADMPPADGQDDLAAALAQPQPRAETAASKAAPLDAPADSAANDAETPPLAGSATAETAKGAATAPADAGPTPPAGPAPEATPGADAPEAASTVPAPPPGQPAHLAAATAAPPAGLVLDLHPKPRPGAADGGSGGAVADLVAAEAADEDRLVPAFASRRSGRGTGAARARVEPPLTAPARREDAVTASLIQDDAGTPPGPIAAALGELAPVAPAPVAPTPGDLTDEVGSEPDAARKSEAQIAKAQPDAGGAKPTAPHKTPLSLAAAAIPEAGSMPPARSAGTASTEAKPSDPPVLRRLPPVPPRLKSVAGQPPRRAPVINFGPKRAARQAAKLEAGAGATRPETATASDPESRVAPATDLSVFGARTAARRRSSPLVVVVMTLLLLATLAGLALWSTFWPETEVEVGTGLAGSASPDSPAARALDAGSGLAGAQAAVLPVPDLPVPDLAAADVAAADLAVAEPVLPGDPEAAADLAGRPLGPGPETTAPDLAAAAATDRAALPAEDAAPLPAALDPGLAAPAGPAEGSDLALADPAPPPGRVDDEALADGEPDVLLDAVPGGGAVPDRPAEDLAASDAAAFDAADAEASESALVALADPVAPAAETAAAEAAPTGSPAPDTPALPQDPVTELVGTDNGAAERVAAQLLEALTPEVAERRYAASGVWVLPPEPLAEPGVDSVDDLYVAAIDTQIEGEDAVALPAPERDAGLLTQLPPPPAGTRFDLDARGLVRATPEGALNPDGILIFLGPPALVPAPRPGSAAPAAAPAPLAEGAAPAAGATPAAPTIRPRPRPEDLTELQEKATLGGHTRIELAGLRPRQRPAVIEKLALATRIPDAEAVDAVAKAANAAVAQLALELAPATEQAVQASLLPRTRPGSIVQLAAAARAAPAPVVPAPAVRSGGGEVSEDDGEPVLASAVMPKLPTKAAVAKTATVANAINLSKINLIGVYGSSASRRALVRLANGKYVKVQIGDRLDGGKVAAIGESELIYVKSGRQHKLQMPSKT